MDEATAERLWSRINKDAPDGCWLWTGGLSVAGYGRIRINTVLHYTHRLVYELLAGPIPEGLEIDHLCRVRACCNPAHLEPVTHAENVRREDASVTHCPKGHAYEGHNLIRDGNSRKCRICVYARHKRWRDAR